MRTKLFGVLVCGLLAASMAFGQASISIVNGDAPGVGFNDVTPAAPVGGNPGLTLGQQRMNVYLRAASIFQSELVNPLAPIRVFARWSALTCTATSAVLGSAGPTQVFRFSSGAPILNSWYHAATAGKIAGGDLLPTTSQHISAQFNVNLGTPGCLTGSGWYLGYDGQAQGKIDLLAVLLHELGHGLGFSTVTSGSTGSQLGGFPAVWDWFLYDNTVNLFWRQMTDAQRFTSARNNTNLVWRGPNVLAQAPSVLRRATTLQVIGGSSYTGAPAGYGPRVTTPITGQLHQITDPSNPSGAGCTPLSPVNAAAANGNIVMVERGGCLPDIKVKNAQNAGAVGVIVINFDDSTPVPAPGLAGYQGVTIPVSMIRLSDGNALKTLIATRSRRGSGVGVTLSENPLGRLYQADSLGYPRMYAPTSFASGSSVSHWDVGNALPLLMQPFITPNLTDSVKPPKDLTMPLFNDIGW